MSNATVALEQVLRNVGLLDMWEARAETRGEARGEVIGIQKIARNALTKGLPLEVVKDITGLDENTIRQLEQNG